ncbi:MAG TPA: ABC transporter permease [Thermoanaerobaculia bacterium]|nr:ABC transporter permease [Thermoanaerobaculia bacterium]
MQALARDLRYALRRLLANPGFTVVAAATLALGIGANTAISSVVDGALLRPLPYAKPDRLFTLPHNLSPPELADAAAMARSFESAGGAAMNPFDIQTGAEPVQGIAGMASGALFETLGVRAALGRTLNREDDRPGGERVVVLGHSIWQRVWASDRTIVGKSILLGGAKWTVVGVMGPEFALPEQKVDLYVPLWVAYPAAAPERGVHFLRPVFRLKPGVTVSAARADLDAAFRELARRYPESDKGLQADLSGLLDSVVGDSRRSLAILAAAVGLVLLIACANLANLQMTNVLARSPELSIRVALGASRRRILGQILTESAALGLIGGALGFLLGGWGVDALLSRFPEALPRLGNVSANLRVGAFTLAASLATSVLFGIVPAWQASGRRFGTLLGSTRSAGLRDSRTARGTLVVSEIALALVLLVGAGLLLRVLWRLQSVEPGFRVDGLVAARIDLPESRYEKKDTQTAFRRRLLESLSAEPGVRAALVSELPMSGDALDHDALIDGAPPVAPGDEPSLYSRSVMGDYFGVMGIPLRSGRFLTDADRENAPLVGVVNEAMARRFFPGSDPIGRRVRWARMQEVHWITIVGVVGDVRHFGLADSDQAAVYTPFAQADQDWKRWSELVVRGPGGPAALENAVRRRLHAADPLIPITRIRPVDAVVSESLARQRFGAELLSIFAGASLALACVGIFGVMWNAVKRRRAEIGVRMALGAGPGRVVREVLADGLRLVGLGVAIGIAAALVATRWMGSLLVGVPPTDPLTFGAVATVLAAAALLACWIPARAAARTDPMTALRSE